MQPTDPTDALRKLDSSRSKERMSGAQWLRKHPASSAAGPLHDALEREIGDVRTWEVQYQMILALAACQSARSIPLLERVLTLPLKPMVHLAAGEALVRLAASVDSALETALAEGPELRLQGAVRGIVMRQAVPRQETVDRLLVLASAPQAEGLRFWVAAAAAGWRGATVQAFLQRCLNDPFDETRRAAKLSLGGKYGKWKPL